VGLETSVTYSAAVRIAVDGGLTTLTAVIVLARLATMQRPERARFGWAAFAIIFGVVSNDIRNANGAGDLAQIVSVAAAYLTVVMPLSLMYAILRRHVIDVRFVISLTLVYAVLTTLLVGVIGIVDWLTSAYLTQVRVAMAIDAAVTIALAFALHRAYGWIESAVDLVLFRRKHETERYLRRLAYTLAFAQGEEAIDTALVEDPHDRLDLTAAVLYRARGFSYIAVKSAGWALSHVPQFDRDHDLVRFLLAERANLAVNDLRSHVAEPFRHGGAVPAIAFPLFQSNRLTAFALYGIHRDGPKLDPDEVGTLEHVCAAAAQAYTGIELARYQSSVPAPMTMEAP
jgi:hypothetical protein